MIEESTNIARTLRFPHSIVARLWCLPAIMILAGSFAQAQTTIIVAHEKAEVWIGADSLLKYVNQDGTTKRVSMCKIMKAGDIFHAAAGILTESDSKFDVSKIVSTVAITPGGFSAKVEKIREVVKGPLDGILTRMKQTHPDLYEQKVKGSASVVLTIVVAGIVSNVPQYSVIEFMTTPDVLGPKPVWSTVFTCANDCVRKEGIYVIGRKKAIEEFGKQFPKRASQIKTSEEAVRFLLTLEINGEPDHVGPPIDLLKITRKGPQWIDRKPECKEQKRS